MIAAAIHDFIEVMIYNGVICYLVILIGVILLLLFLKVKQKRLIHVLNDCFLSNRLIECT